MRDAADAPLGCKARGREATEEERPAAEERTATTAALVVHTKRAQTDTEDPNLFTSDEINNSVISVYLCRGRRNGH